jgi:carboxyl-terminal processing protease
MIREMLSRLERSHFALLAPDAADALPGPAAVPIELRMSAEGAVITRILAESATGAGLAPGQVVLSIDGRAVGELGKGIDQRDRRTASLQLWRRINSLLHGLDGSQARLRVRDVSGRERDILASRAIAQGEQVTFGNLPPLRVRFSATDVQTPAGAAAGLIAFNVWMASINEPFAAAVDRFRNRAGIVIDLRGNPGGLAAMMGGTAGHFIAEPVALGTMRTRQLTLTFTVNPRLSTADGRAVDVFRGPVAILVDELTGSTSETFVGSLQGLGRARVFGRQTMGQALPALTKQLPTGDVLVYAIGDYKTSTGRSLEGAGVAPDVSILLSARALAAGRDEVLEAALKWIDLRLPPAGLVAMLPAPASRLPSARRVWSRP